MRSSLPHMPGIPLTVRDTEITEEKQPHGGWVHGDRLPCGGGGCPGLKAAHGQGTCFCEASGLALPRPPDTPPNSTRSESFLCSLGAGVMSLGVPGLREAVRESDLASKQSLQLCHFSKAKHPKCRVQVHVALCPGPAASRLLETVRDAPV